MLDQQHQPFADSADPHGAKANYDVNAAKLHREGAPGLWRQVSNLLILTGIIAVIVLLFRLF